MRELSTLERATRLVEIATGERWGDGMLVTDVIVGCAEPGYYSSDDVVLVLGDWNPKRYPRDDDAPLTKAENIGPRLANALETAADVVFLLDESSQFYIKFSAWTRDADREDEDESTADED